MFWFGKKKKKDQKSSREDVVKQAMSNVRKARAEIGEETLDKIAQALEKRGESLAMKQARAKIQNMDQNKMADGVRAFLDED